VTDTTTYWPIGKLNPHPHNPRLSIDDNAIDTLAASIKAQGILQPLLITPLGQVVAGHRRLAAAKRAGLTEVPVIVRDLSPAEQQAVMLVENLQRESLSPVEEAIGYQRLIESGCTTADAARRVGVTTARISARMVLLKFDDVVRSMFHRGDLPLTAAPVLARVKDPGRLRQLATRAAARNMTIAQLERIVDGGAGDKGTPQPQPTPDTRVTTNLDVPVIAGTPGRKEALARLTALPSTASISLEVLQTAFTDTCCACGMEDLPDYCSSCPMVQLIDTVVQRLNHGPA